MIILRQKFYSKRHEIGLTEKGKESLRKYRHDIAVDLLEARKKSHKAFKEGWDRREGIYQGIINDYNKVRNSSRFNEDDKKSLDSLMDFFRSKNQEQRNKERSDYNKHLGKLLTHSKKAAKYAQRAANKIGGNGGISKTKLTPTGEIIESIKNKIK